MNERVYKFELEISGELPSFETFPIYDDFGTLIGGFTRRQGDRICGFISGTGYPLSLLVSTEEAFYFTPRLGDDGWVSYGIISDKSITESSVRVTAAFEEAVNVTKKKQ